jgi:hypothetical protein
MVNASDSVLSIPEEYPRSSPESPQNDHQSGQHKANFQNQEYVYSYPNTDAVVSSYYPSSPNEQI